MSRARLIDTTEAPQTVNTTLFSASYDTAGNVAGFAATVVASSASSPTGTTVKIQGSLDGTNWHDLSTNTADAITTVTGNGIFGVHLNQQQTVHRYYRLQYNRSSGSYIATTTLQIGTLIP
jgi:hypothetical protein